MTCIKHIQLHSDTDFFIWLSCCTELLTEEQKQDLKATIDGLKSYVSGMQANADSERQQFTALVQERAQQMKEVESLTELNHDQLSEITALQQVSLHTVLA